MKKKEFCIAYDLGRSMVEMLGVLAIIGVLSIGGLYAYRQAMAKYRANQVMDFINRTQQVVSETCFTNTEPCPFSEGTAKGYEIMCSSGLITDEECQNRGSLPAQGIRSWTIDKQNLIFVLNLYDMPSDMCVELVNKEYRYIQMMNADYGKKPYQNTTTNSLSPDARKILVQDCKERKIGRFVLIWQTEK